MQSTATHCNALQRRAFPFLVPYLRVGQLVIKSLGPQHRATHCNTLQHTATHCNNTHSLSAHRKSRRSSPCNRLQHTATTHILYLRVKKLAIQSLQYTATHCNTLQQRTFSTCASTNSSFSHCNTLQHTATHCNNAYSLPARQKTRHSVTAIHCNKLQYTATHCNTLQQRTFSTCASKNSPFSH